MLHQRYARRYRWRTSSWCSSLGWILRHRGGLASTLGRWIGRSSLSLCVSSSRPWFFVFHLCRPSSGLPFSGWSWLEKVDDWHPSLEEIRTNTEMWTLRDAEQKWRSDDCTPIYVLGSDRNECSFARFSNRTFYSIVLNRTSVSIRIETSIHVFARFSFERQFRSVFKNGAYFFVSSWAMRENVFFRNIFVSIGFERIDGSLLICPKNIFWRHYYLIW